MSGQVMIETQKIMYSLVCFTYLLLFVVNRISAENRPAPQIQTTSGPIQGSVAQYRGVNVLEYKGIPYAKAPIKERRFLPPTQPDSWIIPIDASRYGPSCMQQGK